MVSPTDKPGLHISPLSANRVDIEQVARILSLACGRNPEEARIQAVADNIEQEVVAARKDERKLFVAIVERKVVGWARIRSHGPDKGTWWLAGIFVHPEHQCRGIGRALLSVCIRHALDQGANTIRSVTRLDNQASIAYHYAVGFHSDCVLVSEDGNRKMAFSLLLAPESTLRP